MGRYNCFLRNPKEEQQVPVICNSSKNGDNEFDILDELEGIKGDDKLLGESMYGDIEWNFMEWDEFPFEEEQQVKEENDDDDDKEEEELKVKSTNECLEAEICYDGIVKREDLEFWGEEIKKTISSKSISNLNLNLNLNHQDVMDAWSNRGSLWADDYSLSMANKTFTGEVPVMEEERRRREARVLRYKEKRGSRLFSKKIRYQVRKLNADKRPRLKGRFVKRVPDKIRSV